MSISRIAGLDDSMGDNPILNADPEGDLFFAIPQISFSGGLSIGLEVGVGFPGVLSASVTGGVGIRGGYWSVQGRAGGLYAGYGSSGAFAGVGYQYNGLSIGHDFGSGASSLGFGVGFGNGYAGSIGLSYGKGDLGFDAGVSSTYMWGTINPGATSESNGGEPDSDGNRTKGKRGLYRDQIEAYNLLVNQTNTTGVETAAWLTDEGVLVSPYEYRGNKNTESSSGNDFYRTTAKGKNFFVYYKGDKLRIRGQVHTHPNGDNGPWYYHNGKMISGGDHVFARKFQYLPVYTIGPTKVHLGIYSYKYGVSYLGSTKGLLKGGYGLY